MNDLPFDVIWELCSHLSYSDIKALLRVSSYFQRLKPHLEQKRRTYVKSRLYDFMRKLEQQNITINVTTQNNTKISFGSDPFGYIAEFEVGCDDPRIEKEYRKKIVKGCMSYSEIVRFLTEEKHFPVLKFTLYNSYGWIISDQQLYSLLNKYNDMKNGISMVTGDNGFVITVEYEKTLEHYR